MQLTRFGVRYSTVTRTVDISKAKKVLGHRPIYNMEEAIGKGVGWYNS